MIDIPSEDEDTIQQRRPQNQNFLHRSVVQEQQHNIRTPQPRHPRVQQNLLKPTMASPQRPPSRMQNAGGQSKAQWSGGATYPQASVSNKMVCLYFHLCRFSEWRSLLNDESILIVEGSTLGMICT